MRSLRRKSGRGELSTGFRRTARSRRIRRGRMRESCVDVGREVTDSTSTIRRSGRTRRPAFLLLLLLFVGTIYRRRKRLDLCPLILLLLLVLVDNVSFQRCSGHSFPASPYCRLSFVPKFRKPFLLPLDERRTPCARRRSIQLPSRELHLWYRNPPRRKRVRVVRLKQRISLLQMSRQTPPRQPLFFLESFHSSLDRLVVEWFEGFCIAQPQVVFCLISFLLLLSVGSTRFPRSRSHNALGRE